MLTLVGTINHHQFSCVCMRGVKNREIISGVQKTFPTHEQLLSCLTKSFNRFQWFILAIEIFWQPLETFSLMTGSIGYVPGGRVRLPPTTRSRPCWTPPHPPTWRRWQLCRGQPLPVHQCPSAQDLWVGLQEGQPPPQQGGVPQPEGPHIQGQGEDESKVKTKLWPHFESQLKWSDEYGGHGEHYYDINHVSAYKEPVHHEPAYAPPKPAYDAGRR